MKNAFTSSMKRTMTVLIATSLLVAFFAAALGMYNLTQFQRFDEASMEQQMNDRVYTARLYFCHDRLIVPCDDISIKEWNTAHPDDTFTSFPIR